MNTPTTIYRSLLRSRGLRAPAALRGGLTLLELLVVLLILSVLAVLAVRTTESIVEQNRYEASQRGMAELREAVLGPAGFVAHTGRLPRVTDPADGFDGLGELLNPTGAPALSLVAAPSDADVLIVTGRAVPYLRTRIGDGRLRDGWGNPYLLRKSDNTEPVVGDPIAQIWSAGANAPTLSASDEGYNTDLTDVRFVRTVAPAVDEISASIVGTVYEVDAMGSLQVPAPPSGGSVVVRYFGPADGAVVELAATPNSSGGFTLAGAAVTIGPRVVRAYMLDSMGAVTKRSPPVRLTLQRGPNTAPSLVLR